MKKLLINAVKAAVLAAVNNPEVRAKATEIGLAVFRTVSSKLRDLQADAEPTVVEVPRPAKKTTRKPPKRKRKPA